MLIPLNIKVQKKLSGSLYLLWESLWSKNNYTEKHKEDTEIH